MRELVEVLARALVDNPNQVEVREIDDGTTVTLELHVAPEDVGKVIGKNGRVARAMRTVLKAGSGGGKKVRLEIS